MKSINQIQIAVQEGKPLTEEEMRFCIESQRIIIHYYEKALDNLVKAIREAKPTALIKLRADFAYDTSSRMFEARKMLPQDWLGPDNIPGTPEYKNKKATGETL